MYFDIFTSNNCKDSKKLGSVHDQWKHFWGGNTAKNTAIAVADEIIRHKKAISVQVFQGKEIGRLIYTAKQ